MTSIQPSEWGTSLNPSPTLNLHKAVQELKSKGIKVHDFGIGEMYPEITVPEIMKQAIKDAIDDDETYYVSAQGDAELIEAISDDFSKNFNLSYSTKQIAICPGPKDAIFKACLSVLSPVDKRNKVVVFTPVFEAFENIPFIITGNMPYRLPTDENFYPLLSSLRDTLSSNDDIALIIINSPNNPSGAVYPDSLLKEMSEIIKQKPHIAVLFDEVYRTICYDGRQFANQTLTIGGASKEVAGTGIRVGYVAGPESLISVISKIQGNTSACVALPCQKGYAKFIKADSDLKIRHGIRDQLQAKRDKLMECIKSHPNLSILSLHSPEGAFYAFPLVSKLYGKTRPDGQVIGDNDESVAQFLLDVGRVAVVAGSLMGKNGFIRLAYASKSLSQIEEGINSLSFAISQLV